MLQCSITRRLYEGRNEKGTHHRTPRQGGGIGGIVAETTGFELGTFSHTIVDAHIYVNHIDGLKEQLKRTPGPLPRLILPQKSILDWKYEDYDAFKLEGYEHAELIKFDVAV